MNKFLLGAAAAAALLSAGSAQALSVVVGAPTLYAPDYASVASSVVWDFDLVAEAGFNFTFEPLPTPLSGVKIGDSPDYITPADDPTNYAAIRGTNANDGGAGSAGVFTSANRLTYISFLLGSPDYYNKIAFYSGNTLVAEKTNGAGGSFSGGVVGTGDIARRVTFFFTEAENINKVVFSSGVDAMEIDTIAAGIATVPEPATWATMLLGFFGLGGVLRSRRQRQLAA